MPFDPYEFLNTARELSEDRAYQDESGFRTSISRAYYSAFLATHKRLQEMGRSFPEAETIHAAVITAVTEINSMAGNTLETLRNQRVNADYKLNAKITRGLCRECTRISGVIHNTLRHIR